MASHLAVFNFSRAIAPMDDPRMAEFVAASPRLNAIAETSPGFVWRYNPTGTDSFNIRVFDDPLIYMTLSVWESVETLKAYVFQSGHRPIYDRKSQWFVPLEPHLVLWWIPVGILPTVEEAKKKLDILEVAGPTREAFNFDTVFTP
jgi:hypothetical protein